MSKQHVKLAIGMGVIIVAVGYLMVYGTRGSMQYFLTVPELRQQWSAIRNTPIRVAGKVTDDPIQWDGRNLSLAFVIGEGQARVPVSYKGVKPDMFRPGVDVIVEGQIGHNGILVASNLMTSCPSKYEEKKEPTS